MEITQEAQVSWDLCFKPRKDDYAPFVALGKRGINEGGFEKVIPRYCI